MALPTYKGSGVFTSGTATIVPPMPTAGAAPAANDILLLVCESENQAITLSVAQGFAEFVLSPQGTGTAGVAGSTRLSCFWKRAVGGDVAPTVADPGDHVTGQIHCFSGVRTSGSPWNAGGGGVDTTADTSGSISGATTTSNDCLVVLLCSSSADLLSTAQFSAWSDATLGSVTERTDNTVAAAGLGGGHGMATGTKVVAGTYGPSAVTLATASLKGMLSIALESANPSTIVTPGVGAMVFAGLAPTITQIIRIAMGVGAMVFTGFAPTVLVSDHKVVTPGVGSVVFTGQSPSVVVGNNQTVQPGTGSVVFAGFAPTVAVSDHKVATPGVGAILFSGFAPTIAVSDHKVATPGLGQVVFTGFAPSVVASVSASPGTGQILFTGYAPTVALSDNQFIAAGVGSIVFTGFAPTVAVGPGVGPVLCTVGTGQMVFTGFAPTVLGSLKRSEYVHTGTCSIHRRHTGSTPIQPLQGTSITDTYTFALSDAELTMASDLHDCSMSPGMG